MFAIIIKKIKYLLVYCGQIHSMRVQKYTMRMFFIENIRIYEYLLLHEFILNEGEGNIFVHDLYIIKNKIYY